MRRGISAEVWNRIKILESEESLLKLAAEQCRKGHFLMEIACYQRAAKLGFAESQYRLGEAYEVGIGVTKSDEDAVYWYTKAAVQRHRDAMCALADYYYNGTVVKKDETLAEALLLLANNELAAKKLHLWFDQDLHYIDDELLLQAEREIQRFPEQIDENHT